MYHIERALKNLRAVVRSKAMVESCITEEFKLKEIAYFTSVYFTPTMRYHVDGYIPCSDLQFFQWKRMTIGASTPYEPTQEE
jgi:hypothetical protein